MKIQGFTFTLLLCLVLFTSCTVVDTNQNPTIKPTQTPELVELDQVIPVSDERKLDERPNIILILTDDQPAFTLKDMPFIREKILPNSVNFENGFATTPLCCPSRTSILTGQYVHNHKVYTNKAPNGGATIFDDQTSISIQMQQAGYKTGYIGKYLNEYDQLAPKGKVAAGWDVWSVLLDKTAEYLYYFNYSMSENGVVVEYPKKKFNFSTDVITKQAIDFIDSEKESPFFLLVGYYNPHSPYIPAPRHKETFRNGSGWIWEDYNPPNQNEKDISDKPKYLRELRPYSIEELETGHKQILRSLLSVDEGVQSIVQALEKLELDKNTVVIYLSDNGITIGEHRFGLDKNCPYEECIKTPFFVYSPDKFTGRLDTHLVANIDIAPTVLDLAGVSPTSKIDGLSMVPMLENPTATWREEILIEHWPTVDGTEEGIGSIIPQFSGIRTSNWKYIEYETGETELYNLESDPYELENIASEPQNGAIIKELKQSLAKLLEN